MLLARLNEYALSQPHAVAVITSDRQVTYAELADQATCLSKKISRLPSVTLSSSRIIVDVVDVVNKIACLFGILGAGRSFHVLDRSQPRHRNRDILSTIGSEWALTDGPQSGLFADQHCTPLKLEELDNVRSNLTQTDVFDDGGYLVFTSGSTGKPKGLRHSERNLLQFVDWQARVLEIRPGSIVAQLAAATFDVSLCEIFGALSSGAAIAVPSETQRESPRLLHSWFEEMGITCAQAIPSMLGSLAGVAPFYTTLECLASVGEPLRWPVVTKILAAARARAFKLYNLYGPTETIAATYKNVDRSSQSDGVVPVGRPIDGRSVRVSDDKLGDLPQLQIGEIVIDTAFSCQGYLDSTSLDQERFRQGPDRHLLTYKTGDLGFIDSNGELHLVGRADRQVKVSGVRVELDSVELAIKASGLVEECAARTRQARSGDPYIEVLLETEREVSRMELENALVTLPRSHWPKSHVCLATLPRLHNGKLDRNAPIKDSLPPHDKALRNNSALERLQYALDAPGLQERDPIARIAANSLEVANLIELLRKEFGPVRIEEVIGARHVSDLLAIIEAVIIKAT